MRLELRKQDSEPLNLNGIGYRVSNWSARNGVTADDMAHSDVLVRTKYLRVPSGGSGHDILNLGMVKKMSYILRDPCVLNETEK